ncbi:MAG: hypothetical protein NC177_01995 [Ruminococcus flavefaciens]|nr:hypothetical protein [Ruminococcus flavefaciens]
MHTCSKIRHKLENEYLAESLKGHIRYFATSYSKCPDHEGRASILLDGKQIIEGSYYGRWNKYPLLPKDENYNLRISYEFPIMDDVALQFGQFDQRCFHRAFDEFDNQSIEKSLSSENAIVRVFALLDRRTGKRRLRSIQENIHNEGEVFRTFFNIRATAEGII